MQRKARHPISFHSKAHRRRIGYVPGNKETESITEFHIAKIGNAIKSL